MEQFHGVKPYPSYIDWNVSFIISTLNVGGTSVASSFARRRVLRLCSNICLIASAWICLSNSSASLASAQLLLVLVVDAPATN